MSKETEAKILAWACKTYSVPLSKRKRKPTGVHLELGTVEQPNYGGGDPYFSPCIDVSFSFKEGGGLYLEEMTSDIHQIIKEILETEI